MGALFQRLDKIAAVLERVRADFTVDGLYEVDLKAVENALVGTGITVTGDRAVEDDINELLRPAYDAFKRSAITYASTFKTVARALSMRHAWRDSSLYGTGPGDPGAVGSIGASSLGSFTPSAYKGTHQEIRRQMSAASETVQTCTPAVSAFTAGSTNIGNGTSVSSIKRGDGLTAELIFADTGELRCVRSGYDPGGVRHNEDFQFTSKGAVDGSHPDWGTSFYGAGANKTLKVIDPTAPAGQRGQMLTNGFETGWAASGNAAPTGWEATTGVAGTEFRGSQLNAYFGSWSLELLGGTGVLTTLEQSFNNYNVLYSTSSKLKGNTVYAVIVRAKADAAPASGAMVVELVNAANSLDAADDDQGVDNTFTIDLTTLTTSWQSFTGVFRTPRNPPDGTKIRLRLTTAVPASREVYLDSVAMGEMTECYFSGPWIALFAGSEPFVSGSENQQRDYFTVTTTNDNGGAAQARRTWHRLTDALFGLGQNSILYPSAAGETIADGVL